MKKPVKLIYITYKLMTEFIYNTIPFGQSNEIFIGLLRYNLQWSFDKRKILRKYPDSLLGTTLDLDPTATNIELTNLVITPTVMSILSILIEDNGRACLDRCNGEMDPETLKTIDELGIDLVPASRYLLIPELTLFSDSGFLELLQDHTFTELISSKFMNSYSQLIDTIIHLKHQALDYLRYIWDHVPSTQYTKETDEYLYFYAIASDNLELLKEVISKRHISPEKAYLTRYMYDNLTRPPLYFAIWILILRI